MGRLRDGHFFCFICELVSLSRRRQRAAKELLLEARAHQAEEDL